MEGSKTKIMKPVTSNFTALEFQAVSWVCKFWANACVADKAKRNRLVEKLPELRGAVGKNVGKQRMNNVPDEVVYHEFLAVKASLRAKPKHGLRTNEIRCEYGSGGNLWRPAALSSEDKSASLLRRYCEGAAKFQDVCWSVTADLFGISKYTVRDKLDRLKKEREFRWPEPEVTPEQRFLVAAFMIGVRAGRPEGELLAIAKKLIALKYKALAVFHLARYASSKQMPPCDESAWDSVKKPLDNFQTNCPT